MYNAPYARLYNPVKELFRHFRVSSEPLDEEKGVPDKVECTKQDDVADESSKTSDNWNGG